MNKIIAYANDKEVEIIIGADTNCHSNLFGEDTNKRGRDFEEFVIENTLAIENVGTIPTFETIRAGKNMATCIDVTLTRDMDDKSANWWVDQTYNGSDHNTITFEIKTEKKEETKSRNWDKGDWPAFTQKLKYVDFHEPETMTEKNSTDVSNKCTRIYLWYLTKHVLRNVGNVR